jgi:hypothetical protein
LYRRLVRPQGPYGPLRKISPLPEFDPRTVQSVANRYTDWAIPAPPCDNILVFSWKDLRTADGQYFSVVVPAI